jgi:hypothetical protein
MASSLFTAAPMSSAQARAHAQPWLSMPLAMSLRNGSMHRAKITTLKRAALQDSAQDTKQGASFPTKRHLGPAAMVKGHDHVEQTLWKGQGPQHEPDPLAGERRKSGSEIPAHQQRDVGIAIRHAADSGLPSKSITFCKKRLEGTKPRWVGETAAT